MSRDIVEGLSRALARGFLVAFDYGHRAPVLYHAVARRMQHVSKNFATTGARIEGAQHR